MKPNESKIRRIDFNGNTQNKMQLSLESIGKIGIPEQQLMGEDSTLGFLKEPKTMGDTKIKIKALEQAISMSKLFSSVTPDLVISLAAKLAIFIKA